MGWLEGARFTSGEATAVADVVRAEANAGALVCSDGTTDCFLDEPPVACEAPASAFPRYVDEVSLGVSADC